MGALVWRDKPGVRADVQRLCNMWSELLRSHGGPMLFGDFTIADAYFAPICMRMQTYALPPACRRGRPWGPRRRSLPGVHAWVSAALAEKDFLDFEEPYRCAPESALGELRWRCTWSVVRVRDP